MMESSEIDRFRREIGSQLGQIPLMKVATNTKQYFSWIKEIIKDGSVIFQFLDESRSPYESAREYYESYYENRGSGYIRAISYLGDVYVQGGELFRFHHTLFYGQLSEPLYNQLFGPNANRPSTDSPDRQYDDPKMLYICAVHRQFGDCLMTQSVFYKDIEKAVDHQVEYCKHIILTGQKRID